MRRVEDPYRVLSVSRGADAAQIKAAHRRLAKRHHPDAPGGDEERFLAVQEAYQLLSDPLRRRDWDRRHAPGPVDARDRGTRTSARGASAHWTREDSGAYRRTRTTRGAAGAGRRDDQQEARADASGSGRDPGTRRTTWSAEGVPWWEDFTPKGRGSRPGAGRAPREPRATDPSGVGDPSGEREASARPAQAEPRRGADMDAFVRSSGAAWSSAARRHFRRDEAVLPSRGAFRYRGTQVVTGGEARRVAEEEAAAQEAAAAALFRRARPKASAAPASRQAFHHDPVGRREHPPAATRGGRPPGSLASDPGPAIASAAADPATPTSATDRPSAGVAARPATAARSASPAASHPSGARRGAALGAVAGAALGAAPALGMGGADLPGPAILLMAAGALAGAWVGWRLGRPGTAAR